MKTDTSPAIEIRDRSLVLGRHLGDSIARVLADWTSPHAKMYRQFAGRVMGLIHSNILMALYHAFPDLQPPDARATEEEQEEGASPMPTALAESLLALAKEVQGELRGIAVTLHELVDKRAPELPSRVESEIAEIEEAVKDLKTFITRATTLGR